MTDRKVLKITETDEAGNVTATYVHSTNAASSSRVDVVFPEKTKSLWQRGLDVFMPAGYPHSVTEDYLEYQIYDSLQAFTSSIASLLSSRAVLSSVGVGDSSASPTTALLLSIFQDSFARLATVVFAARLGTALEPECKFYRLLADVLNDFAFVLDCFSPAFPKPLRVAVLSFASVLRALCGVAAGSAKASLSQHFARWGNLGELNAKDSSQETVISLFGMLVGSLVVSWVEGEAATWTTLILLLAVHLETNRRAVRAVCMRSLNRQRATLVWHGLKRGATPSVQEVAEQERVFERDGVLRGGDDQVLGYCTMGSNFGRFLGLLGSQKNTTGSTEVHDDILTGLLSLYKNQHHLMWHSPAHPQQLEIVIKREATHRDLLLAWWQALAVAEEFAMNKTARSGTRSTDQRLEFFKEAMSDATSVLEKHAASLEAMGWDLDAAALETTSSSRVAVVE